MSLSEELLKVYWQPGCSSCLRAKEFLTRHNIPFVSINVLEDLDGFHDLVALGMRRVPIVRRGSDWVDGQVLADVARIAGVAWGKPQLLSPKILQDRIKKVLDVANALLTQIPDDKLDIVFSQRPYSYRQHACHIFRIVEAFLDLVESGKRLEFTAYNNEIPAHIVTKEDLLTFADWVTTRFENWRGKNVVDYEAVADVYYGQQTLHEFLERSAWHAAQHTRQIQLVVETLGIVPSKSLTPSDLAGLPMPANVWDDTLAFA